MIILYLAVLSMVLYGVFKVLGPEYRKPAPVKSPDMKYVSVGEDENRLEKLETLLAEKNKNLHILQTELKILQVQVKNFDKVKTLLQDEILRLREQNQIFRQELGLPSVAAKENSLVS